MRSRSDQGREGREGPEYRDEGDPKALYNAPIEACWVYQHRVGTIKGTRILMRYRRQHRLPLSRRLFTPQASAGVRERAAVDLGSIAANLSGPSHVPGRRYP